MGPWAFRIEAARARSSFQGCLDTDVRALGAGGHPLDRECERAGVAARLQIRAVLCLYVAGGKNCCNRDSHRLPSSDDIVATIMTTMPSRLRLSLGQLVGAALPLLNQLAGAF